MAGIALIFHRDGSPVPPELLAGVLDRLDHRGPDGRDVRRAPEAVLGCQHFWTTPEAVGEIQPVSAPGGQVWLALDGRLDNRGELLLALPLAVGPDGRAPTDAELALAAYRRWGRDFLGRLLGSFAVVVYDRPRRRILLGRDALGNRSLFYHLDRRFLVAASEEAAVLAHPAVSGEPDETTLARYFAVEAPLPGDTFFREVRELPPASGLLIAQAGTAAWTHWQPRSDRTLRYRREAEYAEHLRQLLKESVRARMRAQHPPAVLMSGGLDSGSVAALAAGERAAAGGRLKTFSWIFDELPVSDEREFMEPMARELELDAHWIRGDDAWPLSELDTWPRNPNAPLEGVYRRLQQRSYAAAREAGGRVLLTGDGGDHLWAGSLDWLRDLLAQQRLATAGRELARGLGSPHGEFHAAHLRGGVARALGVQRTAGPAAAAWLTPLALERVRAAGSSAGAASPRPGGRSERLERILDPRLSGSGVLEAGNAARSGIEVRRPFRDRRVVELFLALPAHQLYRPGWTKWLLRRAMVGLLPEPVRLRRRVSSLFPLCARGLVEREADTAAELLNPPGARWRRYVREDWMQAVFPARIRAQIDGIGTVVPWRAITMELWHPDAARHPVAGREAATYNLLAGEI